jgi:hypothetical protein
LDPGEIHHACRGDRSALARLLDTFGRMASRERLRQPIRGLAEEEVI